ncbi:MAG: V-type ATP synthase subunit I [Treponema sp.]|jgi:V/A-type H+-transporting ATPase subunit I|nr:V-type ATP synthase subunit I [Treponema sp.]
MKQIDLTVLARDIDKVLEYLGREAVMHFVEENESGVPPETGSMQAMDAAAFRHIQDNLDKLRSASDYLALGFPVEPEENSRIPGETEEALTEKICAAVSALNRLENEQKQEQIKIEEALSETRAFARLNAPFADLDQLSYLTLRVGRLDSRVQERLKESLADRAVIIPLDAEFGGDRVLAASSRKGRFALDSELRQANFIPIAIPEGYKGIPAELLSGLESRLKAVNIELNDIETSKKQFRNEYGQNLFSLSSSYKMAEIMEELKARLVSTKNTYFLTGWIPADIVTSLVEELEKLTEGRIAVRSFSPEEIPKVRDGKEKVPVSLNHGAFVRGFEGLVFSYGAPLYGTIDPTPFVAVFFTILFGIMFGDMGQGFVLFSAGLLTGKRGLKFLSGFRKFSVPLIAVGISSIIMGFLNGAVFSNDNFLIRPTMAITKFLTGNPRERILNIMPLPENGGSVVKLFYFFGFTVSVGILLNSIGLIVNIANLYSMKKYEKAFFAKTGIAGILMFWYAVSLGIRFIVSLTGNGAFQFRWFDAMGLCVPVAAVFFGPALWRLFSGSRPVFHEGFLVFIMEGFVEILETVSTYVSNTVSFLRVGAFALSHAVLSFIVFYFAELVSGVTAGTAFSIIILIFGNSVIILLEGLIVAIQVVRLQYYEFFSKFFTETGLEFSPFRFRKGANS